jgi:multidrug efflux pump subunit AcrA (membrane-fusion protein)
MPDARFLSEDTRWQTMADERSAIRDAFSAAGCTMLQSSSREASRLIAVPVTALERTVGLITYERQAQESLDVSEAWLPLMNAIGEIATEFERNRLLLEGKQSGRQFDTMFRLTLNAHGTLNTREVAAHIANDGREYMDCDRVGVFAGSPRCIRLLACSGVSTTDPRSVYVRALVPSVRRVMKSGKPVVFQRDAEPAPRELQDFLSTFPDGEGPVQIAIVPLLTPGSSGQRVGTCGALVIESFDPQETVDFYRRINEVTEHASLAIGNALAYERIPFRPVWQGLHWIGRQFGLSRLLRTMFWIVGVAAVASFLTFEKTELKVEVAGQLRPVQERLVFAPADGLVDQILVEQGDLINEGDIVIRLRSPDLELELRQLEGELATNRQKQDSLQTIVKAADSGDAESIRMQSRLAAEITETRAVIAGLEGRIQTVRRQTADLEVRSPISGYVITWNVEQLLTGRPVRRGDSLLKIADVSGDWLIDLEIPDKRYGYVVRAREQGGRDDLPVSVALASDPSHRYESRLDRVAMSSAVTSDRESAVRVTAPIARQDAELFKPGTSVVGRIHCGRYNVVYVWTIEMVDALKRRFFW